MILNTALSQFLLSRETITSFIGSGSDGRLYSKQRPQGATLPVIVFNHISTPRVDYVNTGASGYQEARYQVDVWDTQEEEDRAIALFEAMDAIMSGFRGSWEGGVNVQMVKTMNKFSQLDPGAKEVRFSADYVIKFIK